MSLPKPPAKAKEIRSYQILWILGTSFAQLANYSCPDTQLWQKFAITGACFSIWGLVVFCNKPSENRYGY